LKKAIITAVLSAGFVLGICLDLISSAYAGAVPPFTTTFMRTALDDPNSYELQETIELGDYDDVIFGSITLTKGAGFFLLMTGDSLLLQRGDKLLLAGTTPSVNSILYFNADGRIYFDTNFQWDPENTELRVAGDGIITGNLVTGTLNFAADAQADDDYEITLDPAITAYITGMMITFTANTANTGACTVNVNSIGAVSLKMLHDQDPGNNYIEAGSVVVAVFDGTNFQMIQPASN
jgi:hypothetical protein